MNESELLSLLKACEEKSEDRHCHTLFMKANAKPVLEKEKAAINALVTSWDATQKHAYESYQNALQRQYNAEVAVRTAVCKEYQAEVVEPCDIWGALGFNCTPMRWLKDCSNIEVLKQSRDAATYTTSSRAAAYNQAYLSFNNAKVEQARIDKLLDIVDSVQSNRESAFQTIDDNLYNIAVDNDLALIESGL